MPRRTDKPSTDNWRRLWESNKKSHRQRARAWLQRLSNSPSPPIASTVPLPTSNSSDLVVMSSNSVIQSPEDQFLHWHQDMEKKQEEQVRQMRELWDSTKHMQYEKDRLWAQVKKRHNLGEGDTQDRGQAKHPTVRYKGKKPIDLDNTDTPTDDELSSGSSPNPSPVKSNRARSH